MKLSMKLFLGDLYRHRFNYVLFFGKHRFGIWTSFLDRALTILNIESIFLCRGRETRSLVPKIDFSFNQEKQCRLSWLITRLDSFVKRNCSIVALNWPSLLGNDFKVIREKNGITFVEWQSWVKKCLKTGWRRKTEKCPLCSKNYLG